MSAGRDERELTLAFLFGVGATLHACHIERTSEQLREVMRVVREVADGELTLQATDAELRLQGQEVPADASREALAAEADLARVVWRRFGRFLFHQPPGADAAEDGPPAA